jgi:quinol monooxygenase YgiN
MTAISHLLSTLQFFVQTQAFANGCMSSIAYRDLDAPNRLVVISKWRDPSSWKNWTKHLDRSTALAEMREHMFGPVTHRVLVEESAEDSFLL